MTFQEFESYLDHEEDLIWHYYNKAGLIDQRVIAIGIEELKADYLEVIETVENKPAGNGPDTFNMFSPIGTRYAGEGWDIRSDILERLYCEYFIVILHEYLNQARVESLAEYKQFKAIYNTMLPQDISVDDCERYVILLDDRVTNITDERRNTIRAMKHITSLEYTEDTDDYEVDNHEEPEIPSAYNFELAARSFLTVTAVVYGYPAVASAIEEAGQYSLKDIGRAFLRQIEIAQQVIQTQMPFTAQSGDQAETVDTENAPEYYKSGHIAFTAVLIKSLLGDMSDGPYEPYNYGDYGISDEQMTEYLDGILQLGLEETQSIPPKFIRRLEENAIEEELDDDTEIIAKFKIDTKGWHN